MSLKKKKEERRKVTSNGICLVPELSGLSKHLVQQLSLSGIKALPHPTPWLCAAGSPGTGRKESSSRLPAPPLNSPLNLGRTKRFTRQGSQLQGASDGNHMHQGWVPTSEGSQEEEAVEGGTRRQELNLPPGMHSTPRQKCTSSRKDALRQDCSLISQPSGIRQVPPTPPSVAKPLEIAV